MEKELPEQPQADGGLSEGEKRADAYRQNAFLELGKISQLAMRESMSVVELQVPGGKLMVPADPKGLLALVESLSHRVQQLEIGFGVVVDMLVQSALLIGEAHEQKEGDTEPPRLEIGFSNINREQFWTLSGLQAETTAKRIRQGILSGGGAVAGAVKDALKRN